MGFWFFAIAYAATFVLGRLLAAGHRSSGAKPTDVDPLADPTGSPIPVVFGRCRVAPAVVWWGDKKTVVRSQTNRVLSIPGTGQTVDLGYRYYLGLQGVLCWGPVEELYEIWYDDAKQLNALGLQNEPTVVGFNPTVYVPRDPIQPVLPLANPAGSGKSPLDVYAPTALGGDLEGGGFDGVIDFHWGDAGQPTNDYLAAHMDLAGVSSFPGLCYVVFRQVLIGNAPRLTPLLFEVGRYPALLGDPTKAKIANADVAGSYDANPAEMIYETLLDTRWSRMGFAAADLDLASFQVARDTLYAEGLGLSLIVREQLTGEALIADILRHIDGVLFEHPFTGLLTLKLARDDYDPATLEQVDANVYDAPPRLTRTLYADLVTDVKVTFRDRAKAYKEQVAIAQNLALQTLIDDVKQESFDFPAITSATVAQKVAWRLLQVSSRSLWRGTIDVSRALAHLTLGDVFKLTCPEYEFTDRIFRITGIRDSDVTSSRPSFEIVEDIFADPVPAYTAPPKSDWVSAPRVPRVPTVTHSVSQTSTQGTIALSVIDTDAIVTAVEVQTQVGLGAPSGWVPIDPLTFQATVALDARYASTIGYRVTYLLPDGSTTTTEGYETFPANGTVSATVIGVLRDGNLGLTPGAKLDLSWDFDCTIEEVELLADQVGDVVLDLWRDSYGNYPPTVADSICAAAKPTISGGQKYKDAVLTGWTTAYTAGDTVRFHIDSASLIKQLTVKLKVRRT